MTGAEREVVRRVRAELERLYGPRLERLILYGSRARGEAHEESDYDLIAGANEISDHWAELGKLSGLSYDLMMETGAFIMIKPNTAAELEQMTLFMENVRREGIPV